MVSFGPLLLMMMCSSIHISEAVSPVKKIKEKFQTFVATVKRNKAVISPFIQLIPYAGPAADAIFNLGVTGLNDNPNADVIFELENLNFKLDQFHVEEKWDAWASGPYYKLERDINLGWEAYKILLGSLQQTTTNTNQNHKDEFMHVYTKYEPATKELHHLLKEKGKSFASNLGDNLAEHFNCHEKDIIEFTEFVNKLIFKGNMMNRYYYKLKNIESKVRSANLDNIAKDAASAMFEIYRKCIIESMSYVEQDMRKFTDKSKNHNDLAKEIQSFLVKTYNSYNRFDWVVVVFDTKNSNLKLPNRPVLSGFTDVKTELVTVAVARQVKGTHDNVKKVQKAIESCITDQVKCYEVEEKLSKCKEKVEGTEVATHNTYTAVHIYTGIAHQSPDPKDNNTKAAEEAEGEVEINLDSSAQNSHIYTGNCTKGQGFRHGKFVVVIKSDEEMMGENPCAKLDCGEQESRGSCVQIEKMFLAICQCNYPYYGLHCENNLKDYGKELEREATHRNEPMVTDLRSREQTSYSAIHRKYSEACLIFF